MISRLRALTIVSVAVAGPAACSLSLDGYAGPPQDAADAALPLNDVQVTPPLSDAGIDATEAGSRYAAAVLADRPIVYFRLGETNEATGAMDLVSGRSGAFRGIPVFGVKGALGKDDDTAMRLDGTNGVILSNVARFGGNVPYTIEAWARPMGIGSENSGHVVLAAESGNYDGYSIFFYQSYRPNIEREHASGNDIATGANAVPSTSYSYIVGTYDGSTERIYVNGELAGTVASANAIPATTTVPFAIGGTDQASSNMFIGDIDEIAAYDHVLSASAIRAHYLIGSGGSP